MADNPARARCRLRRLLSSRSPGYQRVYVPQLGAARASRLRVHSGRIFQSHSLLRDRDPPGRTSCLRSFAAACRSRFRVIACVPLRRRIQSSRMAPIKGLLAVTMVIAVQTLAVPAAVQSERVTIHVAATSSFRKMSPVWAWFGYDEPNYTYMKDGRKLLAEMAEFSPVPVFVRAHNLLTTGDGTAMLKFGSTNAYTEDANGKPIYYWKIVDSIFDTY